MNIYLDWDNNRPVFRRDKFVDSRRCPLVVNSGVNNGVCTLIFSLVYDENKLISFSYSKGSLKYRPYSKQLKDFLQKHDLTPSQVDSIPVIISLPPKEYELLEDELLKKIKKKYKRVKIKGREGTYAYDEAFISGSFTEVHIVELDQWVNSCEVKSKKFDKELDEAIDYFREHDDCRTYGVFIKDF